MWKRECFSTLVPRYGRLHARHACHQETRSLRYAKNGQRRRGFVTSVAFNRFDPTVKARAAGKAASGYKTCKGQDFDKAAFEALLQRKHFLWQSFEPYGSVKGLFDYGPPLEGLEDAVLGIWRDHFVRAEQMLAIKCPIVTPYEVFKASGHVDKFTDLMCRDSETGEMLRADHLIRDVLTVRLQSGLDFQEEAAYMRVLATLDDLSQDDIAKVIADHAIRNPSTDNTVEAPIPVNLMFQTQIGATGNSTGYLRPETAQGQFLAFQRLHKYHNAKLPFASATIGHAFRNEIAPRSSLLRVREFLMAEIEHFVDPEQGKKHDKFTAVEDIRLPLLDRKDQTSGITKPTMVSLKKAVDTKIVDNETLAYFLARIYLFMQRVGIDVSKLRFRQHLENEMAHYATDCWDCELLTSYGWTECVGCADRSAYDLDVHSKATGQSLIVKEILEEPIIVEELVAVLDKKNSGPRLKKDAKAVEAALQAMPQDRLAELSLGMDDRGCIELVTSAGNSKAVLDRDMLSFTRRSRKITTREYTPHVIEPSFGVGRILYSLLEHSYWTRPEDAARAVLSFLPVVAPTKVLVTALQRDDRFEPIVKRLSSRFDSSKTSHRVDRTTGVSIGKRYSRNDELGVPLCVTVDYCSIDDGTFTLRDRDSTEQVRGSEDEIISAVIAVASGQESWQDVRSRLSVVDNGAKD